jgi:tungstate transport system ATP-binding protein
VPGSLYQLDAVRQRFAAKLVLHVPALTLRAGRIYTLAGPNGSGKTTLLGVLGFLTRPSSGDVRFDGEEVVWSRALLLALRRQVTLVHQSPYLFGGTVEENLRIGLQHRRLAPAEERGRVAAALEAVDLGGAQRRAARALSQGEVQRVALARALLLEPRVLLLDEPLANVDRKSAGIMEALIGALPAAGHTVVMSSHDPELPGRFGSEVIALDDGVLVSPTEGARGDHPAAEGWQGAATRCGEVERPSGSVALAPAGGAGTVG